MQGKSLANFFALIDPTEFFKNDRAKVERLVYNIRLIINYFRLTFVYKRVKTGKPLTDCGLMILLENKIRFRF